MSDQTPPSAPQNGLRERLLKDADFVRDVLLPEEQSVMGARKHMLAYIEKDLRSAASALGAGSEQRNRSSPLQRSPASEARRLIADCKDAAGRLHEDSLYRVISDLVLTIYAQGGRKIPSRDVTTGAIDYGDLVVALIRARLDGGTQVTGG